MDAAQLIALKQKGESVDTIIQLVRSGRDRVSTLPEDKLDFLETMLKEIKAATGEMEEALIKDDLLGIFDATESLGDIFEMIQDSCNVKS